MDPSLENRIRERAYEIWIAHGCVDGQAHRHWLEAERQVLANVTNSLAGNGSGPKKRRSPVRAKRTKRLKAAS
jgi:hypothetical protein